MNLNKEPIIHAGFPKCASTFLQQEVFPKLDYELKNPEDFAELGYNYLEDIRDSRILNLSQENNYILSLETFLHLDFPMAWTKYGGTINKEIFISNIKELFKNRGKLLIVIRRQDDLIRSWLKYYTTITKEKHFFIDYPVNPVKSKTFRGGYLKNRFGVTYTHTFDYFGIISRISAGISKDRIHILIFEDLKNNPEKFFKELGNCVGDDLSRYIGASKVINASHFDIEIKKLGNYNNNIIKFIKKLIPRPIKFSIKKLVLKEQKDEKLSGQIMQLYKIGNKKLEEKFSLDIKKYGYY